MFPFAFKNIKTEKRSCDLHIWKEHSTGTQENSEEDRVERILSEQSTQLPLHFSEKPRLTQFFHFSLSYFPIFQSPPSYPLSIYLFPHHLTHGYGPLLFVSCFFLFSNFFKIIYHLKRFKNINL